jgi:hypothetical protein
MLLLGRCRKYPKDYAPTRCIVLGVFNKVFHYKKRWTIARPEVWNYFNEPDKNDDNSIAVCMEILVDRVMERVHVLRVSVAWL